MISGVLASTLVNEHNNKETLQAVMQRRETLKNQKENNKQCPGF